jgi:BirA family biotin operon repressor/biotin-[acetyl-CoA-carboxylase] ligase
MAGVAVHDTLKEFALQPDIKWVNDVLVNEKKVSGILAETVETPTATAVILGIGINLTSRNFPPELADTATSIEAETGRAVTVDELAEKLTSHIADLYQMLDIPAKILEEWRHRSSYFTGKNVRVSLPDGSIEGTTDGLEENGALRVKRPDGSVAIIHAGDVERLRAVG